MTPRRDGIRYKRSRFSTRLPEDLLYTVSHYWLAEDSENVWKVGFTKFATRMLGDLVEHGFSVAPGDTVSVGQQIGWVEGFKAISELYGVVDGTFVTSNPELEKDVTLTDTDPYGEGWLYKIEGTPDSNRVDVNGYILFLDETIDKMQQTAIQSDDGGENA